jgi:hypothetical protein
MGKQGNNWETLKMIPNCDACNLGRKRKKERIESEKLRI